MAKLKQVQLAEKLGIHLPASQEQIASAALKEVERLQSIVEYFEQGCTCSRNYKHLEGESNDI